jgi:hypothetical protein
VQGYLGSVVRPPDLTLKMYREGGAHPEDTVHVERLLAGRRDNWCRRVARYRCRDVYPIEALERYVAERRWAGLTLSPADVISHLDALLNELERFHDYEVRFLEGEELYFNFALYDDVVLVEGGYEVLAEPEHRLVAGLRVRNAAVISQFRAEFERVWEAAAYHERIDVIGWLSNRRDALASHG